MSILRSEIEKRYAHTSDYSAYKLDSIDEAYPAWVFRNSASDYGVFFEYKGDPFSENFAGAFLETREFTLENVKKQYLTLSCKNNMLRNQFSSLSEAFVEPGENGMSRQAILKDPLSWWMSWRELLGNSQSEDRIYDIVAELMAMLKLCEEGQTEAYWSARRMQTHDIEMPNASYEVKSSVRKDIAIIHISSQFQLKSEKPVYLIYTRLEESETGESIDDLLVELSKYQYENISDYNDYIERKGLKQGNHGRKRKFVVLERRKYLVDDDFPLIRDSMFINGKLPDGVAHLEYDLSLDGISYENWK